MNPNPARILKAIEGALSGIVYLTSPQWSTRCGCPESAKGRHTNPTCAVNRQADIHRHIQVIRDLLQVTNDDEVFPSP